MREYEKKKQKNLRTKRDKKKARRIVVVRRFGIEMVFNVGEGGKVRSSSSMLEEYARRIIKGKSKEK